MGRPVVQMGRFYQTEWQTMFWMGILAIHHDIKKVKK